MSVIRTKHNKENPFVQINRSALWSEKLSLKATGLWARCISRPDDWRFSIKELSSKCKEGRRAIDSAIKELIDNDYAVRLEHWEKDEYGKFRNGGIEYVFFEFPATQEEKDEVLEEFKKSFRRCCFGNLRNSNLLIKKETNNTSSSLTPLQGNHPSKKHRSKKTVAKATEEEVSFKSKKAKEVLTNLSSDEQAHLQKVIDRQMSLDQSKFISESYKVKVVENFRSKSSEAKEKKEEHLSKEKEIEINKLRAKAVYEEFLKDPEKWIGKMSLEGCSGNLWIENKGSAVILSPCQSTKSWHEKADKWRVKNASQ